MEAINANIRVIRHEVQQVTGYLYDIQGIQVLLHPDIDIPDKFACTEYTTGKSLMKKKDTMQEALDATAARIFEKGPAVVQQTVHDIIKKSGAIN
jgi:hypothetical protein